MSERIVHDLSGGWEDDDWEDDDDDLDFLSEDEQDFLEVSESNDFVLEYDTFFSTILTGVVLSHNLNKKIELYI